MYHSIKSTENDISYNNRINAINIQKRNKENLYTKHGKLYLHKLAFKKLRLPNYPVRIKMQPFPKVN